MARQMERNTRPMPSNNSHEEATRGVLQTRLDKAQSDNIHLERDLKHLQREHQTLLSEERDARKEASYWRAKHDAKATDLTECKNALFDLQPVDQIPDSQIAKQWSMLCQAIEQWVDEYTQPDFNIKHSHVGQFFDSDRVRTALKDCIAVYWDQSTSHATPLCAERFEYLVRCSIHSLLETSVFNSENPIIGLRAEDVDLLTHIQELLGRMTPRRDDTHIVHWKSEALQALCSTENYVRESRRSIRDIVGEAKEFLVHLAPGDRFGAFEAFRAFEQNVVGAAVYCDRMMRLSATRYCFSPSSPSAESVPRVHHYTPSRHEAPREKLSLACFETTSVIDIKTGKTITSRNIANAEERAWIGEKALDVYPALYCRRGKNEVLLAKQLILAEIFDVPRQSAKEKNG